MRKVWYHQIWIQNYLGFIVQSYSGGKINVWNFWSSEWQALPTIFHRDTWLWAYYNWYLLLCGKSNQKYKPVTSSKTLELKIFFVSKYWYEHRQWTCDGYLLVLLFTNIISGIYVLCLKTKVICRKSNQIHFPMDKLKQSCVISQLWVENTLKCLNFCPFNLYLGGDLKGNL